MTNEERNNLENLLATYHAGVNNVKYYNSIPPFKETQDFVKRIMDNIVKWNISFIILIN